MADWKVSRECIQIFPHPNSAVEKLELGKVGQYQVVVGKGIFKDNTIVIFAPEKSILPDSIADEGDRRKYLVGNEKNRVKALQMQKELSQGIILDDRPELADVPIGEDVSARLGITRYVAPIPAELEGEVYSLLEIGADIHRHDVEGFNIHGREFVNGEQVLVTEKINGTLGSYIKSATGQQLVTSKELLKKDQFFTPEANNAYKRAANKIGLFDLLEKHYPGKNAQAFAEVIPFQKGYNYGMKEATAILYRLDVNGETLSYPDVPDDFKKFWVPVLYQDEFDLAKIKPLREGKETVSGQSLHIREGIVVSPLLPRKASGGFRLFLKLINSRYTPDEEEIN